LGGHGAVYLVVNRFYDIMLEDPRVSFYFANTDMAKQRNSQIEFISMVTGGPNHYAGKDMKTAHCPYKISHMEFDATWENLEKAFHYFKVDKGLIKEVKDIFYSVEGDIVREDGQKV
jgi:hemoglobin